MQAVNKTDSLLALYTPAMISYSIYKSTLI